MSTRVLRRRYSAPAPMDEPLTTALKDTPLPKMPTLNDFKAMHTPKKAENPAATRAFATPELLDEVLKHLTPREAIATRRMCTLFSKAVAANSRVEKKLFRKIGPKHNGAMVLHFGQNAVDRDAVQWEESRSDDEDDAAECVPWDKILGGGWRPEHPTRERSSVRYYSIVAGCVFDSPFLDIHTPCDRPFCDLPTEFWGILDTTSPACQLRSCSLHLRTVIDDHSYHVCANHPHSLWGMHHDAHVWAQLEPEKPEAWSAAIGEIMLQRPLMDEVWKFADLETTEQTKYLRQSKSFYTGPTADALVGNVLYQWDLTR